MNYQIRLVVGDAAPFFLSEWEPGGVEISDTVIGLYGALTDPRLGRDGSDPDLAGWASQLDMYGLSVFEWTLTELIKIGLSPEWTWRKVFWPATDAWERHAPLVQEAERRLQKILGPGLRDDKQRQVKLLKLIQAVSKREGEPIGIEGEAKGVGGRNDEVVVFKTGIIAYDRTPHPLPFLKSIARIAEDRHSSV